MSDFDVRQPGRPAGPHAATRTLSFIGWSPDLASRGDQDVPPLLSALQESNRTVVLDCPPVMGVAETSILATKADGVLVVVNARNVDFDRLVQGITQLRGPGANIIGIVLDRVRRPKVVSAYSYIRPADVSHGPRHRAEEPPLDTIGLVLARRARIRRHRSVRKSADPRRRPRRRNVTTNYLTAVVAVLVGFFTTPILTHDLGHPALRSLGSHRLAHSVPRAPRTGIRQRHRGIRRSAPRAGGDEKVASTINTSFLILSVLGVDRVSPESWSSRSSFPTSSPTIPEEPDGSGAISPIALCV